MASSSQSKFISITICTLRFRLSSRDGGVNVDEFECLKEKQPKSTPYDLDARSHVVQKNTSTAKRAQQR